MQRPSFFLNVHPQKCFFCRLQGDDLKSESIFFNETDEKHLLPETDSLKKTAKSLSYDGAPVVLGLPADWVFTARIRTDHLPRKHKRNAMIFRMEEQLPLDAETLTTDFGDIREQSCTGMAVNTLKIQELLECLEKAGIDIDAICATDLLVAWHYLQAAKKPFDYCLLSNDKRFELLRLADSQVEGWYSIEERADDELIRTLQVDLLSHPLEHAPPHLLTSPDIEFKLMDKVHSMLQVECHQAEEDSYLLAAAKAAVLRQKGQSAGWMNFRTGALSTGNPWRPMKSLLRFTVGMTIAAAILFCATLWFKAVQYEQLTQDYLSKQAAEYRKLYPNTRVPLNIKSRIQSELLKISGLRGTDTGIPQRPNALKQLRLVLKDLPPNMRLRIMEIRIGKDDIFLNGKVRSHSDAETITQILKKAGFMMEPPRTQRLNKGGVSFTIAGKISQTQGKPS